MNTVREIYLKRSNLFSIEFTETKKRLFLISILRLIAFISILISAFYLPKQSVTLSIMISVLSTIVFLYLLKSYLTNSRKKDQLDKLIGINKNEIKALNYEYEDFENGSEFIDHDHPFSFDLDIFGIGSLFQYLNRTSTFHGKKTLAKWLSEVNLNYEEILKKQELVKELASKIDIRQNFQATGQLFAETKSDYDDIINWLSEKDTIQNKKIYIFISYLFPLLSVFSVILAIVSFKYVTILVSVFLFQLFIVGLHLRSTNRIHSLIGKKLDLLRKIYRHLAYIENENFQSRILLSMQNQLNSEQTSAHSVINKFSKIVSAFDNRLNFITGIFLNGLMIWDIQCMLRIEKWKRNYKEKIPGWFNIIGEFDAYCSLSNFRFNHPAFCFAEPDDEVIVSIKGAGHPLISEKERVCNDFDIDKKGKVVIVTGANMAGKSTFLRTVALNLVLASNGTPVCAKQMKFKPMYLYTSMRTSDSLKKNESYFYAELKRLKDLIDQLRIGNELFIVLDEILKGTNSSDKQRGSKEVLKQIIELGGSGLIATHDLDLAGLEQEHPQYLTNKCFEIEIKGTEIFFDYKLYDGITKKMNATLLMRQMGIIKN